MFMLCDADICGESVVLCPHLSRLEVASAKAPGKNAYTVFPRPGHQ